MKFFIITRDSKNIAVVFHDYLSQHYVIKSKSEAFRKSFIAAVSSVSYSFSKADDSLIPLRIGIDNPLWINSVLSKSCGKFWQIGKVAKTNSQTIEQIIDKYLS